MASGIEVINRADGTIRYRAVPWDATLKKRGKTKVFLTESEAVAYKRWYEDGADETVAAWGAEVKRNVTHISFPDYCDKFAARGNGAKSSQRDRKVHAKKLRERFPAADLHEFCSTKIELYMEEMAGEGKAPGTLRKRLTFLRTMFTRAVKEKLIPSNPCDGVPVPPRITLKDHRPPTEAELALIVDALGPNFEVAVWLANDSGLRASEVCGLRWHRVDLDNRRVTVKDVMEKDGTLRPYPKGKEARTVPLSARCVRALRKAKMRQGAGPMDLVLRGRSGGPVTQHNLSAYWKRHVDKIDGVAAPKPVFHDLRHGCAHRLVRAGIEIHVLQAFMGHALITTTRIYMPLVDTDDMAAALDRVPVPDLAGEVIDLADVS